MSSPDTPQEKKRLSYLKDRRNVYGERGANSRHAIRRSKDLIERSRRHGQNQLLRGVLGASDEAQVVSTENAVRSSPLSKKKFHKMRDEALGKVIPGKLEYREFKGMGKKKVRTQRGVTEIDAQPAVQADGPAFGGSAA